MYETNIKAAVETRNMDENMSIPDELLGVGIPVVSTILHFVYPDTVLIVGARIVQVWKEAILKCGRQVRSSPTGGNISTLWSKARVQAGPDLSFRP